MEEISPDAVNELREKDPLFDVLYDEHVFLNEQLDDFKYPTVSDERIDILIKNLKKLKLTGKDKMIKIAREYGYL